MRGDAPNVAFSAINKFLVRATSPPRGGRRCRATTPAPRTRSATGVERGVVGGRRHPVGQHHDRVTYPNNKLARALKDVAAIIKAEVGVKVVAVDLGGWDHHTNLSTQLGQVGGEDGDGKAVELDGALKAFRDDLSNSGGTNYLDSHADAVHDRVRPPRRRRTAAPAPTTDTAA